MRVHDIHDPNDREVGSRQRISAREWTEQQGESWRDDPATEAQLAALERHGYDVDDMDDLTKGEACDLLSRPTAKQKKLLQKHRLWHEDMSFDEAGLKRVAILSWPAVDVIRQQDGPATLFYCDPPYLKSTRKAPKVYEFEMTKQQHLELLDVLKGCKGKVMLSGYPSRLYDRTLADWNRHTFDLPNHAANGATKRRMVECLWCNF